MAEKRSTSGASKAKAAVKKPASKASDKSKSASNGKASSSSKPSANGQAASNGSPAGDDPGMMVPMGPKPTLSNGLLDSTANPDFKIARRILGVRSKTYRGPLSTYTDLVTVAGDQPLFMRYFIPAMLRDPEIWYGLEMLRGPIISKAKYKVVSPEPEVQAFVERQIKRFWTRGIQLSLSALAYGFIGLETVYDYNKRLGCIEFKGFKYIHPNDARPVLVEGALVGMVVKRMRHQLSRSNPLYKALTTDATWSPENVMYLGMPKIFWAVHDQKTHRWFGRSRLEGSFLPWYECWQPQGYRSIRHGWFYRHCYDSGVMKYPPGATQDEDGNEIPNVVIATEMLDRRETGAGVAIENSVDGSAIGWDYIPPTSNQVPEGLFDYGESLRDEKWEGMGVPPEVAKAESTGSFAGRRVPQQAFYSFLQEIANEQMFDFDEQCLRFITRLNYGPDADYDIEPVSIMETLMQEEMGGITGHLPGDENDPFYQGGESPVAQSGGRIEDRDSNAFNQAEQAFTANAGR